MQSIKTWKFLLLVTVFSTVNASAQKYYEQNQEKIHAIEMLWKERGIPAMAEEWAGDDPERQRLSVHFLEHNREQVTADRTEFFAFVNNPDVKYPGLVQVHAWLDKKHNEYFRILDEYAVKNVGVPLNPPVVPGAIYYPGQPSVYTPSPPLSLQCDYIGFEGGMTGWSTDTGFASGAVNPPLYGMYTANIGTFHPLKKIQAYNTVGNPYDPLVGGTALTKIHPGSAWSVKLENSENGYGLSHISKKFVVDASDPWIVYRYAVILQDPGDHDYYDRPFFEVKITDDMGVSIPCAYYKVYAEPPIENFAQIPGTPFYWRDWTSVVVPLDDYIGQEVTLHFTVGDCALGGHLAYAYIDGDCLSDDLSLDDNCVPDQIITAPKGFDFYHWTGEDIQGDNYRNELHVTKAGFYQVHLTTVTGCAVTREISVPDDCPENPVSCNLSGLSVTPGACNASTNTYDITGSVTVGGLFDGYILVKAGPQSKIYTGPFSSTLNFVMTGFVANGQSVPVQVKFFTRKHFSAYTLSCQTSGYFTAPGACGSVSFECEDCIKGFEPEPGKTYTISTWVKKDGASPLEYEYTDPFVKVGFYDGSSWTYQTFYAEGEIIDGWQRISEEFEIPLGTESVSIQLGATSAASYFDDLRIYPSDGTFKTFVYDPVSLRLVAELDENNYATFYEYDEEGALVRIKKETERGIMTIQENRNYKVKQP